MKQEQRERFEKERNAFFRLIFRPIKFIFRIFFIIFIGLVALSFPILFVRSIMNGGLLNALVFLGAILFVASLFISRRGVKKLAKIKGEYFLAIGRDVVPTPPRKQVFCCGLLVMLPFNYIWWLTALLIPLGGSVAWLSTSFPALIFSIFQMVFFKERCKDLDSPLWKLWITEFGIYLFTLLIGVPVLLIKGY